MIMGPGGRGVQDGEGGGEQVKFYPYKKGAGGKSFSHAGGSSVQFPPFKRGNNKFYPVL